MDEAVRRGLPLLLTALTILVLALLPPRLSQVRDEKTAGVVHGEALSSDSNFPAKAPDLPGRIRLLALWLESPGECTIVQREIEDPAELAEAEALARAELESLTAAGILPAGQPAFEEAFLAARLYLRDQEDLSSAGFLTVWATDREDYELSMVLDLETGQTLSFRLLGPAVLMEELPSGLLGERFLNRLEPRLSYQAGEAGDTDYITFFRLDACPVRYRALAFPYILHFTPETDREAVEETDSAVPDK